MLSGRKIFRIALNLSDSRPESDCCSPDSPRNLSISFLPGYTRLRSVPCAYFFLVICAFMVTKGATAENDGSQASWNWFPAISQRHNVSYSFNPSSSWALSGLPGSRGGEVECCFHLGRLQHFYWFALYPSCSRYSGHIGCCPAADGFICTSDLHGYSRDVRRLTKLAFWGRDERAFRIINLRRFFLTQTSATNAKRWYRSKFFDVVIFPVVWPILWMSQLAWINVLSWCLLSIPETLEAVVSFS